MELLFVKGEKGLAANKNGKFYFPDRKSNIVKEGVYSCEVTIDKDNYAFVNGYAATAKMPDEEFLRFHIHASTFETNPMLKIDNFSVRKIGDSFVTYKRKNDFVDIGFVGESGYVLLRSFEYNYRRDAQTASLYKESKFDIAEEFVSLKATILAELMVEINDENRMAVLAQAICSKCSFYKPKFIKSIKVVDNKFISLDIDWYGNRESKIYGYSTEHGLIGLGVDDLSKNYGESGIVDIAVKDIVDWMVENHIGIGGWDNQRLYTKSIHFMGEQIDVTYINGQKNIADVSEEEKEQVKKSFEAFEAFRKHVGKYVSKENISAFQDISPKKILGLA